MIEINGTSSCGIDEISGISNWGNTPEGIVKHILTNADKQAHFNFSDITKEKKTRVKSTGAKLAKYIKAHRLGRISSTPPALNKNSGNTIKQWTWTPNYENLKLWKKLNNKKIPKLPEEKYPWQ